MIDPAVQSSLPNLAAAQFLVGSSGPNTAIVMPALTAHCNRYKGSEARRSAWQLVNSFVPFLACMTALFAGLIAGFWPALVLAVPAGGFLIRLFIIQHDCGHGSFWQSRRANEFTGRALSLFTLAPYYFWRRTHAIHHATAGHLDKRGIGDVDTLTVQEYQARSALRQLWYRIYRHPLFLFGFGVPFDFIVLHRMPFAQMISGREVWRSIVALNLAMVLFYGALGWLVGLTILFWAMMPMLIVTTSIGGWLFFVQHQFPGGYWKRAAEWNFHTAAFASSSYYAMPRVVQWFTGNIGLHHIHHLCSLIPNYKLQACLDGNAQLQTFNRVTIWQSLQCAKLTLWDEAAQQLVTFRQLAAAGPAATAMLPLDPTDGCRS